MTNVHRTISGPSTHFARVGNASFPAWRMPNGDEVVDLRTSTDVKGELALNESFLRVAGVPDHVIEAAKTSSPVAGFLCISGAQS
jgi:hypothetical protein